MYTPRVDQWQNGNTIIASVTPRNYNLVPFNFVGLFIKDLQNGKTTVCGVIANLYLSILNLIHS